MQTFKNDEETNFLIATQGEANITTITFKIPYSDLGIEETDVVIDDYMGIIQFKDDYLTTIPKTNLLLEKEAENFKLTWTVGEAITLVVQRKEFQIILKNKKLNKVYKSPKTYFYVTKNLPENDGCECDTTCISGYLEQFAIKINNIIENGVGDFVARVEFTELTEKVDNLEQETNTSLEEIKKNVSNLQDAKLDVTTYTEDKGKLASKEDLKLKADLGSVYPKNETYTKEEVDEIAQGIVEGIDISDQLAEYVTNQELQNKEQTINSNLDLKQNKTDDGLNTTNKTIVGAINEVNGKIGTGQAVDLSNYYDKGTVDSKLSEKISNTQFTQLESTVNTKQNSTDSNLQTTAKNIVEAINEVNAKTSQGGGATIDDTTPSTDKVYSSQKTQEELNKKVNSSEYNAKIEELQPKEAQELTTDSKNIVEAINATYDIAKKASESSSIDPSTLITNKDIIKTDYSLAMPLGAGQLTSGNYSISIANALNPIKVGSDTVYISGRQIPKDITNVPNYSVFINTTPQADVKSSGYNVAIGRSTKASGSSSTSVGASANAKDSGVALGYYAKADDKSIAIGYQADATGSQYYKEQNICMGFEAGKFSAKSTGSGGYYSASDKQQCMYIGGSTKTRVTSGLATNENVLGYSAYGRGDNTFALGNSYIERLYCQATTITQSCDPRLKENFEEVDVNTVIDALMQVKVIRASYRNLEEFRGTNANDKHKLMWDANNMSNIPLFAKDVKTNEMIVTPLNENGEYLKTRTVTVTEQEETKILDKNGDAILKDVEVEKEIPETETIEDCKEFTPNQIIQALVVGFQEQQRMILELQNQIKVLQGGI